MYKNWSIIYSFSQGEAQFRKIMASVDPNMSGYVKFDSFLEYLTRQATDTDSADSLIESFRVLAQDRVRFVIFSIKYWLCP